MQQLLEGLCVGVGGGLISGLFGVSPGGILVPLTMLLVGSEQHVAQGISLICQVAPTSLASINRYRVDTAPPPARWLIWLVAGFFSGSVTGAFSSGSVSDHALQWTYVIYLLLLEVLLLARREKDESTSAGPDAGVPRLNALGLLLVGGIAGFSSGFLGIGGGLALVVGLSGVLKLPQHLAQQTSLYLSLLPLTAPAAFVYWHLGSSVSWWLVAGTIVGLWGGGDVGARLAVRLSGPHLRFMLAALVILFAAYMAAKALDLV